MRVKVVEALSLKHDVAFLCFWILTDCWLDKLLSDVVLGPNVSSSFPFHS